MSISVREALRLECFKGVRFIAGEAGFDRLITRVSVLESPDLDDFGTAMGKGDFYISSFYAIKDDPKAQLDTLKILVNTNSSGLCLIDLYMDDLCRDVKEYANKETYPIVMISNFVPYAAVITEIMDAIIKHKEDTITEMTIRSLLQPNVTGQEVCDTAKRINNKFRDNIGALYLKADSEDKEGIEALKHSHRDKEHWSFLKYEGGILIIMSFGKASKERIHIQLKQVTESVDYYLDNYGLGISRFHKGLDNLNTCVREALLSYEVCEGRSERKVYYNDLGVYRLLMLLKDEPELKRYHDEIMIPLADYDAKNGTSLVNTAISYIDNDGNLAKTAANLYQHQNTIRYRLNKVREILDMKERGVSFYEKISIAVKINKIMKERL
ncbi:MAG: PucR family transcriptional regulator ligand-binding domain-containing protein [Bacillota bacterium]|nr:PucR family transcriptional regulator ligand-binding domain-containing protein [Bacillota bacterium]MDD3298420.1 PucR family transcriptional regulator ligand-binding domain-containing protein [Bacillota bacterium]MDD3850602.1 PucR family transcriptional regulator ligand-binding domain-containing protein [Bacillota bacterium]MDD4707416.1 PucR family transcriptional regulator ligand-binding domain-containing protein [Bacillota bacterium]